LAEALCVSAVCYFGRLRPTVRLRRSARNQTTRLQIDPTISAAVAAVEVMVRTWFQAVQVVR